MPKPVHRDTPLMRCSWCLLVFEALDRSALVAIERHEANCALRSPPSSRNWSSTSDFTSSTGSFTTGTGWSTR